MKKSLVEFIGTFFLVFTVGIAVRSGATFAPFAIAGVLMVMIFSGGHISGAHYNPAVSLAAFIRGALPAADLLRYWSFQLLAGLAAGLLVNALTFNAPVVAVHSVVHSLVVEFLFTFALAWVVLNTATAKGTQGNSFYGLAIGGTVLAGAIAVGGISGGAFNPAVGLGVFVMGLESLQQLFIYIGANLAGGLVAGLAFNSLVKE
ncbi:aquaporin [Nibricoccus sp. IMCC34717]|uniref:aquaporin n=1 Tax=Nibricoccus sp. IMCC34717 TaxID=3034021 RepID=UPI00384F3C0B